MMAPQDMLMRLRKGNANEDELISMLADDAKKDPTESVAHKRDQDMWTPLHWAAQDGMLRLTVRLLGLGASANAADVCGAPARSPPANPTLGNRVSNNNRAEFREELVFVLSAFSEASIVTEELCVRFPEFHPRNN